MAFHVDETLGLGLITFLYVGVRCYPQFLFM